MIIKQVIVVRTLYPDNNGGLRKVRSGKIISQACHASIMFLVEIIKNAEEGPYGIEFTTAERNWLSGSFTKICCQVDSEKELLELHENAQKAGLKSYLIKDSGLTEFDGVATYTALAIGPDEEEKLKPITGHLKLY